MRIVLNQFKNLSCYEEFEIQCVLTGISKIDVLKEIGHRIDDYYFFVSDDGAFNWFYLNGNRIEDPGILKTLIGAYIPFSISKCIIPDSVTSISRYAFYYCKSLTTMTIPDSVTIIGGMAFCYCDSLKEVIFKGKTLEEVKRMDNFPFGIKDKSIIKYV